VGQLSLNKFILIFVLSTIGGSAFASDKGSKTSFFKDTLSSAKSFIQKQCIDNTEAQLNEPQKQVQNAFDDIFSGSVISTEWIGNTGVKVKVITKDKPKGSIWIVLHGALPAENFNPQFETMPDDSVHSRDYILSRLTEIRAQMQTDEGYEFEVKLCKDEVGPYINPTSIIGSGRIRLSKGEGGEVKMDYIVPKSHYPDVLTRVAPGI
jgi:hypothetical protein